MYNITMKFSEKLRCLRKEFGFIQGQLAKKIGLAGNRHISLLEQGQSNPGLTSIQNLSRVFGVSTDYLIFEDVPRSTSLHVEDPELYDLVTQLLKLGDQEAIRTTKHLLK